MKKETSIKQDELLDLFENFNQEEIIEKKHLSNIFGGTSAGDSYSRTPPVADDCYTDPTPTIPVGGGSTPTTNV